MPWGEVSVAIETPSGETVMLRVQIDWCELLGQGWYISRGRILGVEELSTRSEHVALGLEARFLFLLDKSEQGQDGHTDADYCNHPVGESVSHAELHFTQICFGGQLTQVKFLDGFRV